MAAAWYPNPIVVHIVAILILFKFSAFHAETGNVPGDKDGIKWFKGITVYDVTEVIRTNKQPNTSEILPKDLYVREVNTSGNYYFVANDAVSDNYYRFIGIEGISIIAKATKANILALKDSPVTNTTILNLLKTHKSFIKSVTILQRDILVCRYEYLHHILINELQISSNKQSIKVGIEYNDKVVEACAKKVEVPLLDYLDHTILRIRVNPKTTMLSYGFFSRHVQNLIDKNRELLQNLCPYCTPYIRLHNVNWNATISTDNYDKYNALLTTYLYAFSKQNSGNEVFIFSPTLKQLHIVPNNVFFHHNVSPSYSHMIFEKFENASSQDKQLLACGHQRIVKLILSNVQNTLVYDPFLEVLSSLSVICKTSTKNTPTQFDQPSNTSLSIQLDKLGQKLEIYKQVVKIIEILRNSTVGITIETVYLQPGNFKEVDGLTRAADLLRSQNVDVGCASKINHHLRPINVETANVSAIIGETINVCGTLFNMSKYVKVVVNGRIEKPQDVLTLLNKIDHAKQHYERLYPSKKFILLTGLSANSFMESSYCSPEVRESKEYYQTLFSFAKIQGWSRLVPMFPNNDLGLWDSVKTDKQLQKVGLKFPVPYRSNTPSTTENELPMTYTCLRRTKDARGSNINFLENRLSGATFQTNLRENLTLSTTELQTLLDVVMSRFSSVEIIAVSQSDFKLVKQVLGADAPSNNNASKPVVYIDVPLVEIYDLQQNIRTLLSSTRTNAGVHVSNWESISSLSEKRQNLWKGIQYSSTFNFGVTVSNCSHEIDSQVIALKRLPFMPQVSYVVCNTAPVVPDNTDLDWMEKYLGTMFYTKSYMEHFLSIERETGNGVEVMFRLNYICSKANQMEKFLRFLNDVNQHSAAYKIRYFIVHAIGAETSSDCSNTWWYPDSYADLSNISNFVNREDEYSHRESRIFLPEPVPLPEQNSNAVYFIIIGPIVFLPVLTVAALLLYQNKLKTKILTQGEIRQFYHGGEQPNPSNANETYLDFGSMKFPKTYEIPLKDIQTEEVIGSGQFGVVHRGILSKRIEVAIKIPRSDCGKEQFKSTLSELKILCHIGEHLNIVSFLGAHTKGIGNGKLYIVIEYCKNGCLLQHLRQNQENVAEDALSLFELYGFSHQIASGMEYIAEKRVIHGDLAARNVLLTSELTCKIADFGLSRRLYEMNEYVKTSQEPLPWRWMAPESLQKMEFTTTSDVWSYGVTLWEIFSLGMVPYPGLNWTVNYVTELENGMRMGKAPHATDIIHAKTLDCWNLNSEERPTFTELKEYFVGLRNEQYLTLTKV